MYTKTLDFGLGEEIDALRESVRRFAAERIAPLAAAIDRDNDFPSHLWKEMGALGLLGVTADPEFGAPDGLSRPCGGHGGDFSRFRLGRPLLWRAFQPLRQPDQPLGQPRAEGPLPAALCSGEHVGALAMSETGAGSDVVSLRLKASGATIAMC